MHTSCTLLCCSIGCTCVHVLLRGVIACIDSHDFTAIIPQLLLLIDVIGAAFRLGTFTVFIECAADVSQLGASRQFGDTTHALVHGADVLATSQPRQRRQNPLHKERRQHTVVATKISGRYESCDAQTHRLSTTFSAQLGRSVNIQWIEWNLQREEALSISIKSPLCATVCQWYL